MAIESKDIEIISRQMTVANFLKIIEMRANRLNETEEKLLREMMQIVLSDLEG